MNRIILFAVTLYALGCNALPDASAENPVWVKISTDTLNENQKAIVSRFNANRTNTSSHVFLLQNVEFTKKDIPLLVIVGEHSFEVKNWNISDSDHSFLLQWFVDSENNGGILIFKKSASGIIHTQGSIFVVNGIGDGLITISKCEKTKNEK